MPIGMIRGRKRSGQEAIEVHEDLEATREKQKTLQSKVRARGARVPLDVHACTARPSKKRVIGTNGAARSPQYLGGRKMKTTDQKSLDDLERKERLLSRKSAVIEQEDHSWFNRVRRCLRPFEVRPASRASVAPLSGMPSPARPPPAPLHLPPPLQKKLADARAPWPGAVSVRLMRNQARARFDACARAH